MEFGMGLLRGMGEWRIEDIESFRYLFFVIYVLMYEDVFCCVVDLFF